MDMGYVKDIKDLKIDASLGKEERILSYLEQMENPYEYQDGDTREKSATPQSFDIIIDNAMILSNIKSPSGKQTLDFGEFDGKEITGTGYKITFQFTSHWE